MAKWQQGLIAAMMVLLAALVIGCPPTKSGPAPGSPTKEKEEEEGEPPHGGQLFAPEGKHDYHVELKVEDKKATAYLLDKHVKKPVSTPADTLTLSIAGGSQITFKPHREDKDPQGESSRFVAEDPALTDKLDLDKVTINVTIAGKPYVFKLDKD